MCALHRIAPRKACVLLPTIVLALVLASCNRTKPAVDAGTAVGKGAPAGQAQKGSKGEARTGRDQSANRMTEPGPRPPSAKEGPKDAAKKVPQGSDQVVMTAARKMVQSGLELPGDAVLDWSPASTDFAPSGTSATVQGRVTAKGVSHTYKVVFEALGDPIGGWKPTMIAIDQRLLYDSRAASPPSPSKRARRAPAKEMDRSRSDADENVKRREQEAARKKADSQAPNAFQKNLSSLRLLSRRGNNQAPSPDGKYLLVYTTYADQLAEICVYDCPPVTGRRVAAEGKLPVWSPDGQWIAYVNDGICIVSADGRQHRRLTKGGWGPYWMAWAPDGAHILHCSGNPLGLHSIAADGSRHVKLLEGSLSNFLPRSRWIELNGRSGLLIESAGASAPKLASNLGLAWIDPKGGACAVLNAQGGEQFVGLYGIHGLYKHDKGILVGGDYAAMVDLESKRVTVWSAEKSGMFSRRMHPVVSPDGTWMAYGSNDGTALVSLDSKRKVRIQGFPDPAAVSADNRWIFAFEARPGYAGRIGDIIALDWQRRVRRTLVADVSSPSFDADNVRVKFSRGQEMTQWKGDILAWANLEDDPPVIHITHPCEAELRQPKSAPEIPHSGNIFDAEAETPGVYELKVVAVKPLGTPLGTAIKEMPNQTLDLAAGK